MDLNGKRFGIYIPLGYPSPSDFADFIVAVSKYVDLIEIGIPTEKPIYDGPIIRRAHREIIGKGYDKIPIDSYRVLAGNRCDKVALAYYSDVRDVLEEFIRVISDLGFRCLLAPDLLIEYPEDLDHYVDVSNRYGLKPCFFISTKFPYNLVRELPDYDPYMIYLGLQASTGASLPIQVLRNIAIARSLLEGRTPLAVGFGINSVERVITILAGGADIAIIGTEILRRMSKGVDKAMEFVIDVHRAVRGGSTGSG
ncbi:MAG: tryptophan synthase subunit alpha [Desulfurococcales archaeon]|jgi:tryptophan synthase alpha chain|nr:tryptophan synthase subunit alpha [Desulfurococcales archaeon]